MDFAHDVPVQSLVLENFNEQQIAKIEKSNEILNILQNLSKCDNDRPKNTEILREKIQSIILFIN